MCRAFAGVRHNSTVLSLSDARAKRAQHDIDATLRLNDGQIDRAFVAQNGSANIACAIILWIKSGKEGGAGSLGESRCATIIV
jgi:hypothetical protein